jgi:hypothetical protein
MNAGNLLLVKAAETATKPGRNAGRRASTAIIDDCVVPNLPHGRKQHYGGLFRRTDDSTFMRAARLMTHDST